MWTFNVCTYNVMTPVLEPLRFNGQMERLGRIPLALAQLHQATQGGLDVVVFQELIPGKYRRFLLSKLTELGWCFHSSPLQNVQFLSTKMVSGGVIICSRFPILAEKQHVFTTECCGTDCLASKGVVYTQILGPQNNVVNVVATHFQAWATPEGVRIRRAQSEQCLRFIKSLNIPPTQPVIVVGDFNLDYYAQRKEVMNLEKHLQVKFISLHPDSHPFSSDPSTNAIVGNDDASMYSTRLYPHGCYDTFMTTLACPCCPQELLDYVGYSTNHLSPSSCSCSVVILKTEPFLMKMNMTTEREVADLSDHYPLVGTFQWVEESPGPMTTTSVCAPRTQLRALAFFTLVMMVLFAWCLYLRRSG